MRPTSIASLGNLSQFAIVDSERISNLISSAGRSIHFCRAGWKMVPARVTSSCLCKKSEGTVLPLLIEPLKNRIDDSLHAGHIHEQHHGPGAPADFHEASFDGIGRAQLAPQRLREIEERQQFGQI